MSTNITGAVQGGNLSLSKAGLAAGTTTTYTIASAITYALQSQLYSKGAVTNAATPTADANTGAAFKALAASQSCIFLFLLDAAGTVWVAQGPIVSTADMQGGYAAAQFPGFKDTLTPFGYLLAQASAALVGTWLFGTNNLSGVTGMTYLFRDMMDIPGQPITA